MSIKFIKLFLMYTKDHPYLWPDILKLAPSSTLLNAKARQYLLFFIYIVISVDQSVNPLYTCKVHMDIDFAHSTIQMLLHISMNMVISYS